MFSNIKGDIFGGVTAAVIALPLALAFGVASGAGATAGLYGAIAVGFFAALFGGTPSQVSGPTGPMTVAMAAIVSQYASTPLTAFAIVILAGLLQVAFGLARIGRYVSYTPYSVVSGFMSGIGVIIILIQTLPFAGLPAAGGGPLGAVHAWQQILSGMNVNALIIAVVSLGIMVFWPNRLAALLPAPLAALLVGSLLGLFVLSGVPVIGEIPSGFPQVKIPTVTTSQLADMVQPAIIIALLGSIDSLLTSLVADSITRTKHKSDRELIGQGIGNMAAGFIGGLPGAGATMRTVINVRAGGRTPLSGMLHALILLALALGLGPLAAKIPQAVLAGILMKVGWDIIDWRYLKRLHKVPRDKALVMLVTFGMTVFVDLITAVAIGLILAGFVNARRAEKHELEGVTFVDDGEELDDEEKAVFKSADGQLGLVQLRGRFSFASARQLTSHVGLAGKRVVVFDFSHTAHLDASAAMAIDDMFTDAGDQAIDLVVCGLSKDIRKSLDGFGILDRIEKNAITEDRLGALRCAVGRLSA